MKPDLHEVWTRPADAPPGTIPWDALAGAVAQLSTPHDDPAVRKLAGLAGRGAVPPHRLAEATLRCTRRIPGLDGAAVLELLAAPEADRRGARIAWCLPAWIAGHDPGDARRFADALAPSLRWLHDLAALWIPPPTDDGRPPFVLGNNLVLSSLLEDPELARTAKEHLAGRPWTPARLSRLRRWMGSDAATAVEQEAWTRRRSTLQQALPEDDSREAAIGLLAAIDRRRTSLVSLRDLHLMLAGPLQTPALPEPADALEAAAEWLLRAPELPRAWEIQRWGAAGRPGPLIGRHWLVGLVRLCLHEAGVDQRDALAQLISELDGPLRWYGRWPHIPPDLDSLGLFLEIAATLSPEHPGLADRVHGWLAPLSASLAPEDALRTWLTELPEGPACPEPRSSWDGDDCQAVHLAGLCGLLAWDPDGHRQRIETGVAAILDAMAAGGLRLRHYPPATADLLFARMAARYHRIPGRHRDEVRARLDSIRRRIIQEQGLDGGWGSPQRTAARLELVALNPSEQTLPLRLGIHYLLDNQRPDGSWPAEPWFIIPGRPPVPVDRYASDAVTTALCCRGLAAALRRLSGGTSPPSAP